jgi:hypothetical protein
MKWAGALVMEAVSTSEPSVNFYETTRHNIPEGCNLHFQVIFDHLSSCTLGLQYL